MNSGRRTLYSLFLASASLLLFEMTQIRIFAYSLTPILAYTAISLSMTGFGVGAMLLSLVPSIGKKDTTRTLSMLAVFQSVSMVLSCILLSRVSWDIILTFQHSTLPLLFEILIPSIVPHFFMGLFVAIVFSTSKERIGKVYFFNLLGSGIGCVAIVLLLRPLGADKLIIISSILSALAAILVALPRLKPLVGVAAVLTLLGCVALPFSGKLMPFAPDPIDTMGLGILEAAQKGRVRPEYDFAEWNVVGKVEVWNEPALRVHVPEELEYRVLSVDSGGSTQLLSGSGPEGWGSDLFEQSIYGIAYGARPSPNKVLVLGCGGGMDVQSALHWNAKHVTAIEINASTVRAVTGPYAPFLGWPQLKDRVRVLHDDGRSFVKATSERFDVIQMTGVDTITVYATGSINMNEDSLYTVDAFEDYLSVLEPDGVYAVLRVGKDYIRLTAIATEALLRLGVKDPGKNIVAFRQDGSSGVLVKRQPFKKAELDSLEQFTKRKQPTKISMPHFDQYRFRIDLPMELLYTPGRKVSRSFGKFFNVARTQPSRLKDIYTATSVVVPTDDNPYYMLGQLLAAKKHPGKFKENFEVMQTFWIAIISLAIILILVPVAATRRRMDSWRPMMWVLPYFFLIGLCFMLLEICVIHILAIFVGSPGASLAVVLTSILVFSGIGAYTTEYIKMSPLKKILLATGVLTVFSLLFLFLSKPVFDLVWSFGAGQVTRGIVAGIMVAPIGLALGWFFPTGLNSLGFYLKGNQLIPWAVSINGFASVLGSVVVLPFSMYFGFRALFVTAIIGYLLTAAISFLVFRRREKAA